MYIYIYIQLGGAVPFLCHIDLLLYVCTLSKNDKTGEFFAKHFFCTLAFVVQGDNGVLGVAIGKIVEIEIYGTAVDPRVLNFSSFLHWSA